MKTCATCSVSKPLDAFYRRARSKDGRDTRCRDCEKVRLARWAQDNPDRTREAQQRYNRTEKSREKCRRWRENNPERAREVLAAYKERNPDAIREAGRRHYYKDLDASRAAVRNRISRRRARMRDNGVFAVTTKDVRRILAMPCAYCGSTDEPTLDHVIPISRGGRHSVGNLQCLCAHCNFTKHDKLTVEFRYRHLKAVG
jgi:5-methylcytosine-specific restriction endonuclease McrA